MGTTYAGFNPFSPPGFTATYGRFITGLSCDDGDLDDAAVLNALAMACMDNNQWLAWRTINIVEGDAGNSALTQNVNTYNGWIFRSNVTFVGPQVLINSTPYLYNGKTFHVGDAALGIGHIVADGSGAGAGSDIQAINGARIICDGAGSIRVTGGAEIITVGSILRVDSTSLARFERLDGFTVNPGDDNALSAGNICKCLAVFATDGAGGFSAILGGYNIASVAVQGTNFARITFVRSLSNGPHCVGGSIVRTDVGLETFIVSPDYGGGASVAHIDIAAGITTSSFVDLTTTAKIIRFNIMIFDPIAIP